MGGGDCCGLNFMKNVLNVFNIIFLLVGLGVLGVALWTVLDKYQYVTLLASLTYPITIYFLLAAGALVIFVSFMGCFAVLKEHRPLLLFVRCLCLACWNSNVPNKDSGPILLYIFLLGLIFLIELMVGVLAYIYEENVRTELELNLNNTLLTTYKIEEEKTAAVDFLQENFRCCGAVSFTDWRYSVWLQSNATVDNLVPDSCCKTVSEGCGTSDHPSNINYAGCLDRMALHLEAHLIILHAVGLGVCLLQIFGIVLACKLYLKLKNSDVAEGSERNVFL